jgi:hypothetical protein
MLLYLCIIIIIIVVIIIIIIIFLLLLLLLLLLLWHQLLLSVHKCFYKLNKKMPIYISMEHSSTYNISLHEKK